MNAIVPLVVAPAYAMTPLGRTHHPPRLTDGADYKKYRGCLRLDFNYRCCYCLSYEAEVAPGDKYGLFEVEHFRPKGLPKFFRFRNHYANLLWACHACNRAKLDQWPTPSEETLGLRFVDPSAEPMGQFLTVNGVVVDPNPAEPAAQYMIDEINLNSDVHKRRRELRAARLVRIATLQGYLQVFRQRVGAIPALLAEIAEQEDELKRLQDELGGGAAVGSSGVVSLRRIGDARGL